MRRLLAGLLILGAFCALLGLGTWQLQRLEWKQALIVEAETRPSQPPRPLARLLQGEVDDLAYRRASVTGRFTGPAVRVFTTLSDPAGAYEGPGYWLMAPFQESETGATVFVNRGFIPFVLPPDATVRPAPQGIVAFQGLIRPDDRADWMTPDPDIAERIAYRRDIAQLSMLAGIADALPVTLDMPAGEAGALPQAGETKFAFSNRHLEYAITWYALAVVLVGVVGVAVVRRRRHR